MTKTIFYDVDTQNDFMNKNGALYVPNAESIKPNLENLTKYACEQSIPIFGSVDRHFGTKTYKERELELSKWGGPFPEHCMDETEGQQKINETILIREFNTNSKTEKPDEFYRVETFFVENPLFFKEDQKFNYDGRSFNSLNEVIDRIFSVFPRIVKNTHPFHTLSANGNIDYSTPGIFFEKQSYEVTTNPYFDKVMEAVKPEKVFVYGVATDYCVRAAVKGLVKHAKEVYVITDTIKGISEEGIKETFEEWKRIGVKLTTTKEVLGGAI